MLFADLAIAAVVLPQADPSVAFGVEVLFALPGIYIVFPHGPKLCIGHIVLTGATVAIVAARLLQSGQPGSTFRAVAASVLFVSITAGVLLPVQFGVWLVRTSSVESLTDPLTKLANGRGLYNCPTGRINVLMASPEPLCAFVIDLDAFKRINDRHGHHTGDAVIIRTAQQIRATVRPSAFVVRTGGEEFVVIDLLPAQAAQAMAERVRGAIESLETPRSTASIGVAVRAIAGRAEFDGVYADADDAMYVAKRDGGNRIVVAGS